MIQVKDIMEFIESNKGNTIDYGSGYSIQVYDGSILQANVSYNGELPFLKIEQRKNGSITVFMVYQDNNEIINYACGCTLLEDEPVINLFKKFSNHPKIERALIALLELH